LHLIKKKKGASNFACMTMNSMIGIVRMAKQGGHAVLDMKLEWRKCNGYRIQAWKVLSKCPPDKQEQWE
jgi:hypothetical protein